MQGHIILRDWGVNDSKFIGNGFNSLHVFCNCLGATSGSGKFFFQMHHLRSGMIVIKSGEN